MGLARSDLGVEKEDLQNINPKMALALIMAPTEQTELVKTKFGKSPKGSFASSPSQNLTLKSFVMLTQCKETYPTLKMTSHIQNFHYRTQINMKFLLND